MPGPTAKAVKNNAAIPPAISLGLNFSSSSLFPVIALLNPNACFPPDNEDSVRRELMFRSEITQSFEFCNGIKIRTTNTYNENIGGCEQGLSTTMQP
eukprot:8743600-Ditylum_brightwellii.AAC.1